MNNNTHSQSKKSVSHDDILHKVLLYKTFITFTDDLKPGLEQVEEKEIKRIEAWLAKKYPAFSPYFHHEVTDDPDYINTKFITFYVELVK